jgi:coenzyme F420 hydrogenase subunit beta
MGGEGEQWLLVRNEVGEELVGLLGDELHTSEPGSKGKRDKAVQGFIENTRRAAGGLPLRSMPDWLRPLAAWLQPRIGPRGLEFARARVEMKAAETVLHLRRQEGPRMKNMVPAHVWKLVEPYGLKPKPGERSE